MSKSYIAAKRCTLILSLICYVIILVHPFALAQDVTDQQNIGRVQPFLLKAVVKIVSPSDSQTGTGFLVSREVLLRSGKEHLVFLVTNKHVVGDWDISDGSIINFHKYLDVYFYRTTDPSGTTYKPLTIPLLDNAGKLISGKLILHSNPKIDVAVIALDQELLPQNKIDLVCFDVSFLLPFNRIATEETTGVALGDQVFALGYPFGITSLSTSYPIAKGGYIASLPGQEFRIDVPAVNRQGQQVKATIQGKILLVDGLIVPGNSGGPVVIPAETRVRIDPKTKQFQHSSQPTQNLVLGIVSAGLGSSGLTVVLGSDYILELINTYQ
ncbi:MAG TPA: S1 family peptidase [Candidatus Brocadiaceae bacterium]